MRIIIEIDDNKEPHVQLSGFSTGNAPAMATARPDVTAVDAGRAKVGTGDQGSPSLQNESNALQGGSTSGGSGPGNQPG
jgi:hypothetical protein